MKKHWKLLSIISISTILITACGTQPDADHGQERPAEEEQQQDVNQVEEPGTNDVEKDVGAQRPAEQEISYLHEGMEHVQVGTLYKSSEQPFNLYTLPNYQASPEEPGKDIILYNLNEEIYMQIEVLPEDVNWNVIEEQATAQLKSIHQEVKTSETAFIKEWFPGSKTLYASNSNVIVHKILVKEHANQPNMLLTIHSPTEGEAMEPILAMARTIESTEN